jgi:hypothetical protein
MLAQILDSQSIEAAAYPASRLEDVLAVVAKENPDLVFLSGLPPFALARAHRTYRVLQSRNPRLRIMLGFWSYGENLAAAGEKFTREEGFQISTTLGDAVAQVRAYFHLDEGVVADPERAELLPTGSAA